MKYIIKFVFIKLNCLIFNTNIYLSNTYVINAYEFIIIDMYR